MTDLETIRRLSAQEQREPALQLAEQVIREMDVAVKLLRELVNRAAEGSVLTKAGTDGYAFIESARAFLHQRDR